MMTAPRQIEFGIPSFDHLLGPRGIEVEVNEDESCETLSMCIVGGDGAGKSVLALHLASRYLWQQKTLSLGAKEKPPQVYYVTTDLNYERARKIWENFLLDWPSQRIVDPFRATVRSVIGVIQHTDIPMVEREAPLLSWKPLSAVFSQSSQAPVKDLSLDDYWPSKSTVNLLDLASTTTGDDWGFLNRMLAGLPQMENNQSCHLLIIDAVEGLEVLAGEKDAFGEARSRRSRIAQLLRTAKRKCHVVLIVEESVEGVRVPEEFVTDVVIRLLYRKDRDYVRRTIEIEKARGQSHARGAHDFAIRPAGGSKSGEMFNPDEPPVPHAYLIVFPSLHLLYREIMWRR